MQILYKKDIEKNISLARDLAEMMLCQKQAFIDFSTGSIITPKPLQMSFKNPPGDCHVKAGFHAYDDTFVIKVATGFYQNKALNLPAGDGAILIFSKTTGILQSILCDNGYLTILRTALAACVASQIAQVTHICIVGDGNLGEMTAKLMGLLYPNVEIAIWNRSDNNSLNDLLKISDLVITTTASKEPIIKTRSIKKNTHIIALGADELGKQELEPEVFHIADKIIVDSKNQAIRFGDSYYAIESGVINANNIEELGDLLAKNFRAQDKIIITDLTGIAAQDIAIAKWALNACISIK